MSRQSKCEEEIDRLTAEALRLIREAEKLADEGGVRFSFDVAYGMGGTYCPKGHENWDCVVLEERGDWMPSSHSC